MMYIILAALITMALYTVTHRLVVSHSGGSGGFGATMERTGGAAVSMHTTIAASQTDEEHVIAIDVSQIKMIVMLVTGGDLTVETNNSGAPDDTISLTDGEALIWMDSNTHSNPLGTDVTTLYLTTGAGSTRTFHLECVYDETP